MAQDIRPNIFPTLRYRDADAALQWLKRAFGFEEKAVYRAGADGPDREGGTIHHAELRLGAGVIMFGAHDDSGWMGGEQPQPLASTMGIYVVIEDPDAHHEQARAAGAQIVRQLTDRPYGSREYSARDLEGNLWSFGTYDPYEVASP
jgi:uncharacterized glyoxalase superfamily protein PhnB